MTHVYYFVYVHKSQNLTKEICFFFPCSKFGKELLTQVVICSLRQYSRSYF
jgi:hypothetical protein